MSFAPDTETFAKPQVLLSVPVGLASPLWGLFAGAAMTGATWWWMTRWARPQNLEAMLGAATELEVVEPEAPVYAAPVVEVVEVIVEAMPEPVFQVPPEPAVEAAPEPVVEAVMEATIEPLAQPIVEASPTLASEAIKPEIAGPMAVDAAVEPALAPRLKKKPATPPTTDPSA